MLDPVKRKLRLCYKLNFLTVQIPLFSYTMRYQLLLSSIFCFWSFVSYAQNPFAINPPVVNSGIYSITDTVYMSPNGNDANYGTINAPVLTFVRALNLLPFGTVGVNNGQAYGLIRLLPGNYIFKNGLSQSLSFYQKNNTYKNVSIEGIDKVSIGGTADSLCDGHGIYLMGSHIFVKNITIKHVKLIGLLLSPIDGTQNRMSDVLIENVHTDSVGSFGMLLKKVDRLAVLNCNVMHSSQVLNNHLTSPCSWPSGLKAFGSRQISVRNCEVGFSRGEGLNFQNCLNGEAIKNKLHDNTTNLYDDNSKNLVIKQNHFYNSDIGEKQFWRGCPADTGIKQTPNAILLANEGSCTEYNSTGITFENCQTKCAIPLDYIANVDSIFIYNNVFQNSGNVLNLWEGNTQTLGINCIKNVFFFNNTAVGAFGNKNNSDVLVNLFFPSYNPILSTYSRLENILIYNNIFSIDRDEYSKMRGYLPNFNHFHPSKNVTQLANNLWNFNSTPRGADDSTHIDLPGSITLVDNGNFDAFVPCDNNASFIMLAKNKGPQTNTDFYDSTRKTNSNVGAFEYQPNCISQGIFARQQKLRAYPNPTSHSFFIGGINETIKQVVLYQTNGQQVANLELNADGSFHLPVNLPIGLYFIFATGQHSTFTGRIIKRNQ